MSRVAEASEAASGSVDLVFDAAAFDKTKYSFKRPLLSQPGQHSVSEYHSGIVTLSFVLNAVKLI
jgi:hypothetical protein